MVSKFFRYGLRVLTLFSLVYVNQVKADTRGCEEGIIRLPDRNGTIEICSAMAAQVPKLSKQLSDAMKTLGDQKKQISELTRLVKNLNSVGRDIDAGQQERLLNSLTQELEKSMRAGDERTRRTMQDLSDKLDDIQQQLSTARASASGATEISKAMKGEVGDAIARLEFASAGRMMDSLLLKLSQIESKVDAVRGDTTEMRSTLKQIASEISQLGKQGGLIDNPSGYSALYHNARILAQRGELDRALEAYAKVFQTGIPFADPIIDVTSLLVRQYGQEAARGAIDKNFGKILTPAARLYALQLLSDEELSEVEDLYLRDPKGVLGFPPLVLSFLKRIQITLANKVSKHGLNTAKVPQDYYVYSWLDWTLLTSMERQIRDQMSSGNYLTYFIDPIRGNIDIDSARGLKSQFAAERLFSIQLGNWSAEKNAYRKVNLLKSPAVLDYTYFDRAPSFKAQSDSLDFYRGGRPLGTFHLFIWDVGIDWDQPVLVCAKKDSGESCVDLNLPGFSCKKPSHGDAEAINCLSNRGFRLWNKDILLPNFDANFSSESLLGSACISRIEYTLEENIRRKVSIGARDIIGTYRDVYNPGLSEKIRSCGYDLQLDPPPPDRKPELIELEKLKAKPLTFAKSDSVPPALPPSEKNCARIGPRWRVGSTSEWDLHKSLPPYVRYVNQVSIALRTEVKRPDGKSAFYSPEKNACELIFLSAAAPVLCEVRNLSVSPWRDPNAEDAALFPNPSEPPGCKMAPELIGDLKYKILWPPRVSFFELKDANYVERWSIYEKLAENANGLGPGCAVETENQFLNRVLRYLTLEATERGVCNFKYDKFASIFSLEKEKWRHKNSACFTEKKFAQFQKESKKYIDDVEKNCSSKEHKEFLDSVKNYINHIENEN